MQPCVALGCSPALRGVAASIAWGCSLHCIGLQPGVGEARLLGRGVASLCCAGQQPRLPPQRCHLEQWTESAALQLVVVAACRYGGWG